MSKEKQTCQQGTIRQNNEARCNVETSQNVPDARVSKYSGIK